jgi:hypothetical protein
VTLPPHASLAPPAARLLVLADICNVLNPEAIIVGGELSLAGEPLVAGIREVAALGLRAELMGAVATALAHVA